MAFSDYKSIAQVQNEFPVKYQEENFIVAPEVQPDAFFLREFAFTLAAIDVYTSKVMLDGKRWMTQNLNLKVTGSYSA